MVNPFINWLIISILKKTLLFNNVKAIDLNKLYIREKPLSINEKLKRNFIKKQTNKKLQVVLLDPDVYNNDELFKDVIEKTDKQELLIKKLNHRLSFHGFDDFLRIRIDEPAEREIKVVKFSPPS